MTRESALAYEYQVGGSLPIESLTYVRRQADEDLYKHLKAGEFCYVLNSRQMGKSSLRVQVMQQLQEEEIACAVIDITSIGTADIRPEQWYAGVIDTLIGSFNLYTTFDLDTWWTDNHLLSPVQKLNKFIDEVLLELVVTDIVIFIDEIDSILSLGFNPDDFFAVIRDCYNRRADNPAYRRLTFAILGVSTPSDLIQDKRRTPFNIGRAIDLTGFQLEEAQPLARGLTTVGHPQKLMEAVLYWTGGQPFLTQKVCKLVKTEKYELVIDDSQLLIADLVRKRIIENWETQDEPEHLKTIINRILYSSEQRSGRLLGLCQQILQEEEIIADDSAEQTELRLTGLVVKRDGKLGIYNRIYKEVFNLEWCDRQLAKLRPYAETLNAWVASQRQDESRLLWGQALRDAQAWVATQSLTDLDYQYLAASQNVEQRDIRQRLETEAAAAKAEFEVARTREKIKVQKQKNQLVSASFICITGIAIFAGFQWIAADEGQILALTTSSNANFKLNRSSFDALIDALKAGRQLKRSIWFRNDSKLQLKVMEVVSNAAYWVRESNILEKHLGFVQKVRFSPDGQTIATASFDNTAKLWSADGRELVTLKGHTQPVVDVSFSPDGRTIATASQDGTAKLWNREGKLLRTLEKRTGVLWSVSFSPDGQKIASAGEDKIVKLWDLNGNLLKTWKAHDGEVYSITFNRDGKIATGSDDNTVKLWDAQGKLIDTFNGHKSSVYNVSFSPDGKTLASASSDNTVILWNLKTNKKVTIQGHSNKVRDIKFSPDGQTIATASWDNTVKLWRSRDGLLLETLQGHQGRVNSVSFNNDGKILASSSNDKTVKLWRLNDWLTTFAGHKDSIYSVDINKNGNMIATASGDKTVKLWNLRGRELRTFTGHSQAITSTAFNPDGNMIVTGSDDKTVKLWNLQGQVLKNIIRHQDSVNSVSFSPNGNMIASASFDGTVNLWNREGVFFKELKANNTKISSVSFSPDGNTIASASRDGKVQLWSLNGTSLLNWKAHNASVYSIRFSPDNKFIATSSEDNTVKLWTWDGRILNTLNGHTAGIWGLDFSPNGQMIATASDDKTVKIWNRDGMLINTLLGHTNSVNSLKFSRDNKKLVTGSSDKTALLWNVENLSLDKFMDRGCSWLSDYLKTNQNAPTDICDQIKKEIFRK
jgi:WD40 repeat protein